MIFIDTSAFLARYIARDQYHSRAMAQWNLLASTNIPCVTSNFVIDELVTLLTRRASPRFAAERARQIYASSSLQILRPDAADEAAAVILLEQHAGLTLSFTDCVSFALMRRHGIADAFTFDEHFRSVGFTVTS